MDQNLEVVEVKLVTPALVSPVLRLDHPAQIVVQDTLPADVLAQSAAQNPDRIGPGRARGVVPALDGR